MNIRMKRHIKTRSLKAIVFCLCCAGLLLLNGCGSFELKPWVKPYERAHLADPIMSFSPDPIDQNYMSHVYEVREEMHGAEGGAGGGCDCN